MKQHRFFYGWIIVGLSFVNLGIIFGIWYSFSVFFVAIFQEFGWSRAATAGVFSCFMLVHSASAIVIGSFLDRFGARVVIPVGACIVALGLFASSRIDALWQFYLWYGVLTPVGVCAVGFIAHGIILPKWFDRKRGLAIGIAMAGIGLGMQILVPAAQLVIADFGWRTAYCALAGFILITILPLNILLPRSNHQEMGQNPDGARAGEGADDRPNESGQPETSLTCPPVIWTVHECLRSKQFWFLFSSFFFTPLAVQGILIHQVAGVVDKGFSAVQGAFFFGLAGIMGSVGKIFFGWLSDRIDREIAFGLGLGCAFLGVLSLMLLQPDWPYLLYGYAIFFGLGYGSIAPIIPARTADLFLGPHFGKILGMLSIGGGVGGALGVWLSGKIYDIMASYNASFMISLVSLVLAVILFRLAGTPVARKTKSAGSV
ncbi:MAG: MFS transporter [Deltaproteobacteria bacterium]|nr:MFS transporter [Deltaproteobacteria bacterium]